MGESDCQSHPLEELSITKQAVVKELFKQTDRLAKKTSAESPRKKGIKRKTLFASPSKQNRALKNRMKNLRDNLTEDEKANIYESDKNRKKKIRDNLTKDE